MRRRAALLSRFTVVQFVAQSMSLLAGFVFVRVLDKPEYALYVLTTGAIAAVFSLSNSNVVHAAAAIGGRAWQDTAHTASVIASAARVRKRMALAAIIPIALLQGWLLMSNGAGLLKVLMLLSCALIAGNLVLTAEVWRVVLRLGQGVRQMQTIDLVDGATRLFLALIFFRLLDATAAVLILVTAAIMQFALTKEYVSKRIDLRTKPEAETEIEITRAVRRQWPFELYAAYRGQLVIVILALFGRTESVADVGALGRIGILYAIVWSTMHGVVLPAYARCQDPKQLRTLYLTIMAAGAVMAALPVAASLIFPEPLLWVLGPRYGNLSYELTLVMLAAGAAFFANLTGALNNIRNWMIPAWIMISTDMVALLVMLSILGVSTTDQILWASIVAELVFLVVHFIATMKFSRGFSQTTTAFS